MNRLIVQARDEQLQPPLIQRKNAMSFCFLPPQVDQLDQAVWLGGGGVGKTRTLKLVVEPVALTYFGPDGYSAYDYIIEEPEILD